MGTSNGDSSLDGAATPEFMLAQLTASESIVVPPEEGLRDSVKGLIYSLAEDMSSGMWCRVV